MSGFKLQAHEILRDPTKEELYNGPKREKLPPALQRMDAADTACTFCGVSYFVFAEVQELQERVKKYETQCKTFIAWTTQEKKVNHAVRLEMVHMKNIFESNFADTDKAIKECLRRCVVQEARTKQLESELSTKETEINHIRQKCQAGFAVKIRELESKIHEKEQRIKAITYEMELALGEAHSLHEVSVAQWKQEKNAQTVQWNSTKSSMDKEKCRLEELVLEKENEIHLNAVKMQELQAQIDSWDTYRREVEQKILDREQQLEISRNEALEGEKKMQELRMKLIEVQAEAARSVANAEVERVETSHLHEEIAKWKHQANGLEKSKALLLLERQELKQEISEHDEKLRQVKTQVTSMQQRLDEQVRLMTTQAQDHKKALDATKVEWAKEVAQLKSLNANSLDSTKSEYQIQIETLTSKVMSLESEIPPLKQALLIAEKRVEETSSALQTSKSKCQSYMEELQSTKMTSQQAKTTNVALERKLQDIEKQHKDEISLATKERTDWETKQTSWEKKMSTSLAERDSQIASLQEEVQRLKKKPPKEVIKEVIKQVPNNQPDSKEVDRLAQLLSQKEEEIHLLQLTVHRECMERTSMLEKMRSAKIVPDLIVQNGEISSSHHILVREEVDPATPDTHTSGLASFYEKLRKKKPKAKTKS